jgi:hypothetical protein
MNECHHTTIQHHTIAYLTPDTIFYIYPSKLFNATKLTWLELTWRADLLLKDFSFLECIYEYISSFCYITITSMKTSFLFSVEEYDKSLTHPRVNPIVLSPFIQVFVKSSLFEKKRTSCYMLASNQRKISRHIYKYNHCEGRKNVLKIILKRIFHNEPIFGRRICQTLVIA